MCVIDISNKLLLFFTYKFGFLLILFLGQIFEGDDFHVLSPPEFENHIFNVWFVCMCVRVRVFARVSVRICYQHNSKTNCSIIFKFGVLYLYHNYMLHESFYKDRTKTLCTGADKRILIF